MDKHITAIDLRRLSEARRLTRRGTGRELREECGLLISELAQVIPVNPITLIRWEAGDTQPNTLNALAWLDALTAAGALDLNGSDQVQRHAETTGGS